MKKEDFTPKKETFFLFHNKKKKILIQKRENYEE